MTNGLAEKRPTLRSPACIAEPKALVLNPCGAPVSGALSWQRTACGEAHGKPV